MVSVWKIGANAVTKSLKEQGYLELAKRKKIQRDEKRRGCYKMTQKLLDLIKEEGGTTLTKS